MEERVKGELRSAGEIVAVEMPRHLVGIAIESEHFELVIQANRGHWFRFQSLKKQVGFAA